MTRLRRQGRAQPQAGGSDHGRTRPGSARGRKERRRGKRSNTLRAPTSLVGTSPLMRQISAGSPTSAGFGCVDAKLYRAGILDPTTAPSRPLYGATPDHRSRRQRRCGHGLGQVNPAGTSSITPTAARKADSTGGRNTSTWRCHMGRPGGWVTELTGCAPMKSPGRPSLRREVERGLWLVVATGVTGEEAAHAVGVFQAAGAYWFREGGGMPTIGLAPRSGRYLCFVEREGIALLRAQGAGGREIARQLGRSPSTTSESCAAMRPRVAGSSTVERRSPSGRQSWSPVDPRLRSS